MQIDQRMNGGTFAQPKVNKLGLLQLACLAVAMTTGSANADGELKSTLPQQIQDTGVLRVVASPGTPPMMYVGTDGTSLEGLESELTDALAKVLGVKVQYTQAKFDALIPGIKSNRSDVAVGSIGDLKKRVEQVDFVDYVSAGIAIAVPKGNPAAITGIDSLCGHSISVTRGTFQETELAKTSEACTKGSNKAIDIQVYGDSNDALLAIKAGRVESWIGDSAPVSYVVKQSGGSLELAGPPKVIALLGYAVNKDQKELTQALKAGLERLMKDGTYKAIFAKWGLESTMVDEITINKSML